MRASGNQELVNALGTEVKARRQELEFTQEDLAGRCELDRPYISLIEVGRKQPTISVLLKIAIGLNLSLEELAGRVERRYLREIRSKKRAGSGA